MTDAITIDDIRAAAGRIGGHVRRTPMLEDPRLNDLAGRRVLVKCENLQITGSFKARGSWNALATRPDGTAGVIACSSGNHAQGIARAAALHGVPAVIVMPADAPAVKIANTRGYGAEVVTYDRASEDRDAIATQLAAERNLHFIHPFNNPAVMAGQGTTGLEIAAQAEETGVAKADVLVCTGGGGLCSGIALALEADAPGLRVRPVEPEGFDDVARSLASGRIESNASASGSICDAIVTPSPGTLTFPVLDRLAGPGLTVTDDEALRAMRVAFELLRLVVEPGGAVGLAAALFRDDLPDTVVAVLSGGNVDPAIFARAIA